LKVRDCLLEQVEKEDRGWTGRPRYTWTVAVRTEI